jgi:dipeptidyl aminopeptidase/acylaminoacyl peptidase
MAAGSPITLWSPVREGAPADLRLSGRLFMSNEPDPEWRASTSGSSGLPGLVVAHGAGSRASRHEAFCIEAQRQGFAVLALDLRGHGDSGGSADGPLELDILAAADYLRHHPEVDPARIYYRGSSMGGFYGLKAAARPVFAAVALVCPASERDLLALFSIDTATTAGQDTEAAGGMPAPGDTDVVIQAPESRWDRPALCEYFGSQDSGMLATQVTCPVLLIHARGDDQVPISHSLMLADRLTTETLLLALSGGSHTSAQHDPAVTAFTAQWLLSKRE